GQVDGLLLEKRGYPYFIRPDQMTSTGAPVGVRSYRSMMSSLVRRMHPFDTAVRISQGSLVPWIRNMVSRPLRSRWSARAPSGLFSPPGTPAAYFARCGLRLIMFAVGVHDGHSALRPILALPLKVSPSSPTATP